MLSRQFQERIVQYENLGHVRLSGSLGHYRRHSDIKYRAAPLLLNCRTQKAHFEQDRERPGKDRLRSDDVRAKRQILTTSDALASPASSRTDHSLRLA